MALRIPTSTGSATSPGRLQLVGIEPTVLVDAAHNPHGATALAAALEEYRAEVWRGLTAAEEPAEVEDRVGEGAVGAGLILAGTLVLVWG